MQLPVPNKVPCSSAPIRLVPHIWRAGNFAIYHGSELFYIP